MHANKEIIKKLHPCSVSESPYASVLAPSRLRTFPCGVGLWPAGSSGVSPLEHSKIKNGNPPFTLRSPVKPCLRTLSESPSEPLPISKSQSLTVSPSHGLKVPQS